MIIYVFQTFEQSTSYVREIKKRVRGFLLVSLTRANFAKCHVHAQLFEPRAASFGHAHVISTL